MAQYIGNSLDTVFLKTKRQAYTYVATAGQTIFSGADSYGNTFASIERGQVLVYENGVLLEPQSYTVYADRVEYNSGGAALGAEVVVFTEVESALVNSYTRAETESAISTALTAGLGGISLDDLADVDLTTAATDGQALIWDDVSEKFIPGDSFSQADFDSAFTAKSADDLTEGSTNLYYTDARVGAYLEAYSFADESYVDTALSNLIDTAPSTLDTLNELAAALGDDPNFATTITTSIGTKLATADFNSTADTWLGTKTTDELSEGSTNLYYTSARVITDVDNILTTKTTTDLAEGTNLYYTDARVDSNFALKTTTDLAEGSNLYFTAARVSDYLTTNAYATETFVGTAISTASSDYATAAQGALADSALQAADLTGYATETFVGTAISNLVDSSPATLDTLNELAAALGDDPNFATTTATAIGLKANTADLGTAAAEDVSFFATAAQGALADSALQSVAFADLTTTPTTLAGYGITDAPSDLTDLGITDGTTGQILTTDGAGGFTFEDAAEPLVVSGTAPTSPTEGALWFDNVTTGQLYAYVGTSWLSTAGITTLEFSSVGDLSDVDITTSAPTEGQALLWDNTNSKFVPGDVAVDLTGYATETFVNTSISTASSNYATAAQGALADSALQAADLTGYATESFVTSAVAAKDNTDEITEGSTNLYYTDARVETKIDAYVTGGTGVTVTSGEISIGQEVSTTSDVTFNNATVDGELVVVGNIEVDGSFINNSVSDGSGLQLETTSDLEIKVGTAIWSFEPNDGGRIIFPDSSTQTTAYPGFDQDLNSADDVTFNDITANGNMQIDGDLTVSGTTVTINATNLAVEDNMIYLNDGSTVANPDLGFAGNYNDGTYAHAGVFRDATDGVWKFYDSYVPEPDASAFIDTTHATFNLASVEAGAFIGNLTGDVTGTVSSLSNHSTSNLSEGSNLYYTDARVGTYLTNNSYATESFVGSAITTASSNYATAAQGVLADSALQSVAFADLTTTPTTLAGYGITDTIPSALTDLGITEGTTGQVLTTDGAGTYTFEDAASSVVVSGTAPSSPSEGDMWFDNVTTGQLYTYVGTSWLSTAGITTLEFSSVGDLSDVDITTASPTAGQALVWDAVNSKFIPGDSFSQSDFNTALGTISTDIIPDTDVTYDLGSATNRFKDLYLSGNTLYLGEVTLSVTAGALVITDALSNPVSITLSSNTTDDLAEGLTNLYYTDARTDARIALAASDYATAAQGALADTALQAADLTGYATESYVGTQIANLVDTAPSTLDTLNELAAALGDDPNFATTTATSIGLKANTADLATVATSGLYSDLTGAYVDADAIAAVTGSDLDMGANKILYSNVYAAEVDLPTAANYHGMFAHVHGTGRGYFAHAGSWVALANESELAAKADTSSLAAVATSGLYSDITGTPNIPSALTDLGITDGTVGQVLTTDGAGGFTFADASSGGSSVTVSATAPSTPNEGDLWFDDTTTGQLYVYENGAWTSTGIPPSIGSIDELADVDITTASPAAGQALVWDAVNSKFVPGDVASGGGGSSITTSETAPVSPTAGDMWFNSATLALYLYYADGDSTQWIQINDPGGAAGNGLVVISSTPPSNPAAGDLWYDDLSTGTLLIYNGSVWVSTADGGGGGSLQNVDWVEISTTYDAVPGSKLFVDCSVGAVQVNLPVSPSMGDEVYIVDAAGNSGSYNITVNRNGNKITGLNENLTIDVDGAAIVLAYYNATRGWIVISK